MCHMHSGTQWWMRWVNMTPDMVRSLFKIKYIVGWGGFGEVYKVEARANGKVYALKEMSKIKLIRKKSVHSTMNERNILA